MVSFIIRRITLYHIIMIFPLMIFVKRCIFAFFPTFYKSFMKATNAAPFFIVTMGMRAIIAPDTALPAYKSYYMIQFPGHSEAQVRSEF